MTRRTDASFSRDLAVVCMSGLEATRACIVRFGRCRRFALAGVIFLSSCSGGGGDGGSAGGASTPTTYLFFTGGASAALGAVDPGNATSVGLVTVEPNPATIIGGVNPVYGGSFNATALQVNGVHHRAVVYFKDVGGGTFQLFRASALAAPAPVRVSSASFANSGATTLCAVTVYSDFANGDNGRVVYTQAGADAGCGSTADNPLSMATLPMSNTTAPVLHATLGARVIREIRNSGGAISGWIMLLGANLSWYQADMAAATSQLLAGSVTSASYRASGAGKEFLAVDTGAGPQVRIFDGTATLKNPGNAATALTASFDCKADDTYLFCADTTAAGRTIRRLPLDGSATWTAIYSGFSETMTGIVLSENRVLFRDTATAGQLLLSSVPKLPFDPALVFPALVCRFSTTTADERIFASGTRVYCSEALDSPTRVKHIREDGEDEVSITDPSTTALSWAWQGGSTRTVNEFQKAERIVLMGQTGAGVTRLTSYDGPSGLALADLTNTVWTGFSILPPTALADANKGNTLVVLTDSGGFGELFFANNATANSLVRLTATAANSETFVGASGCTRGSGQAPDPLLPALVVLAALYLWRRRRK